MRRYIQKKAILPLRWWIKYQTKKQNSLLKTIDEIFDKKTEMENALHDVKRKNDKVRQDEIKGFIQALDWVCQELNEYKQ